MIDKNYNLNYHTCSVHIIDSIDLFVEIDLYVKGKCNCSAFSRNYQEKNRMMACEICEWG